MINKKVKATQRPSYVINAKNFRLNLDSKTKIMGIINVTPDSFSQDGCLANGKSGTDSAVKLAKKFVRQGADILDIGGESTRPGSKKVSPDEEIKRVIPIIKRLADSTKIPLSVDTYKPKVAKAALDAGASIVNNIKGIKSEKNLLKMVRDYDAAIVLMHIQGTPKTMQKNVHYKNLIHEIFDSLRNSIEKCLEFGIKSDKIIIDPGIGFGKGVEDNLEIINRLSEFKELNQPILVGTSRKSFIGKVLGREVHNRKLGTAATVCASILRGAHIVRVHDVASIKETVTMTDAILTNKY